MRILLIEPAHDSRARGNTTTVARWQKGLSDRGHCVSIARPDELSASPPVLPQLVHAHHALHAGGAALSFARQHGLPFLLSLGGTDINGSDGEGPSLRALAVMRAADLIVGPFPENEDRLISALGSPIRFRCVRRGIALPPQSRALALQSELRVLMAGGLRRSKGQLLALSWLEQARRRGAPVFLTIVGPRIEEDYARLVDEQLADKSWANCSGEVPSAEMKSVWAEHDCLVNASAHEGCSNAILEALANGCCVLATSAPGNVELLRNAPAEVARLVKGDDAAGAADFLCSLAVDDLTKRRHRAELAKSHVRIHNNVDTEIDELEQAYRELLGSFGAGDD